MRPYWKIIALLCVLCALPACRFISDLSSPFTLSATPTPDVNPIDLSQPQDPTPTQEPSPLPPTPGPTLTPAALALPTGTSAPASLNPTGPYVVFAGTGGVWLANPDGSALTQVSDQAFQGDLSLAISPNGDRLAQVVQNDEGLDLVIVDLPGGETQTVTQLLNITSQDFANATGEKSIAFYAISQFNSLAWQPGEGRYLAFTGAAKGTTSDLYLYDSQTREITQLTDGLSQAILPTWSPDGQFILHFGVSWVPPFGGAIVGPNRLDGIWAVRLSDRKVISLPKPQGTYPNFAGWLDETRYLMYDSDDDCYAQNLRSVDVASGEETPVMAYSFYYAIARSPVNGAYLFSSTEGCASSLGNGIYLLSPDQTAPLKLWDFKAYEIEWMAESQAFYAYPEGLFSADGQIHYEPPDIDASFHPAISSNGFQAWEVIENQQGRTVVSDDGQNWLTVMNGLVQQLIWDPVNGHTLLIVLDDGSLYAVSYPDFSPRLMGSLGGGVNQAIWSMTNQQ